MSRTRHYRDLIAWLMAMGLREDLCADREFSEFETSALRMQLLRFRL